MPSAFVACTHPLTIGVLPMRRRRPPKQVFGIPVDETIDQGGYHLQDCVLRSYWTGKWGVELTAPCHSCESETVTKGFDAGTDLTFEKARDLTRQQICRTCDTVDAQIEEVRTTLEQEEQARALLRKLFTSDSGIAPTLCPNYYGFTITHEEFLVVDNATKEGRILIPAWRQDTTSSESNLWFSQIFRVLGLHTVNHLGWRGFRSAELQRFKSDNVLEQLRTKRKNLVEHKLLMQGVREAASTVS
jgi:hypothetical protein